MMMFHIFRIGMTKWQIRLWRLVPIAHNTEDINFDVIYDYLDELEGKLMEHFKNKYNIELLSCETDD